MPIRKKEERIIVLLILSMNKWQMRSFSRRAAESHVCEAIRNLVTLKTFNCIAAGLYVGLCLWLIYPRPDDGLSPKYEALRRSFIPEILTSLPLAPLFFCLSPEKRSRAFSDHTGVNLDHS